MSQDRFDVFLGFSRTRVDGVMPSEAELFRSLIEHVRVADDVGFGTAWISEAHLSVQTQRKDPGAVLAHYDGEVSLNTDTLQFAHVLFDRTRQIRIGSAIRSILCSGGPVAHAEGIRTFLALRQAVDSADRTLEIGFAAGRFDFSNAAFGVAPRNEAEARLWGLLKPRIFQQATEIFLRFLKGETLSSADISPVRLPLGKVPEDKRALLGSCPTLRRVGDDLEMETLWKFQRSSLLPVDVSLKNLQLTLGSHDPEVQIAANRILPCRVFNLSITPPDVIEATHARMREHYHSDGGEWQRGYMPRTVMAFTNDDPALTIEGRRLAARHLCEQAVINYWNAMDGTISQQKVQEAVGNALFGTTEDVHAQIRERYHPEDRLMLWFDFNINDPAVIQGSMRRLMQSAS